MIVSVLTHEAFQYLTMIRRTKVVNGILIETYEEPSDDEYEPDEEELEPEEDTVPITGEEERMLRARGQKAVKRSGKVGGEVLLLLLSMSILLKYYNLPSFLILFSFRSNANANLVSLRHRVPLQSKRCLKNTYPRRRVKPT